MREDRLLALVLLLAPFSLVSFGGGPSLYASLQAEVVHHYRWLTPNEFIDLFAISRAAPGPGIMLSTLIGWKVAGWWGALVATIAIFTPASIMCVVFMRYYSRHQGKRWTVILEAGLAPVAVGLIIAGALSLLMLEGNGPLVWMTAALVGGAVVARPKMHPFIFLGAGSALFMAISLAGF